MIKRNNCDRHDRKSPSPSKRGRVTAAAPEVPTHSDVKSGNTPAVNDELLTLVASYLSELGYKYVFTVFRSIYIQRDGISASRRVGNMY